MSEAEAARAYWAVNHCQSARVLARGEGQDYRYALGERAMSHSPRSILEFGCSSGRNLAVIQDLTPSASGNGRPVELTGIDINEQALRSAEEANSAGQVRYILGDERALDQFSNRRFDVVFTCSVLDHIPAPQWREVYRELVRVAHTAIILLEPVWFDDATDDGSVYEADFKDLGIPAPPYSYSHPYLRNDPALRIITRLNVNAPGDTRYIEFGNSYHLMERVL